MVLEQGNSSQAFQGLVMKACVVLEQEELQHLQLPAGYTAEALRPALPRRSVRIKRPGRSLGTAAHGSQSKEGIKAAMQRLSIHESRPLAPPTLQDGELRKKQSPYEHQGLIWPS